MNNNVNNNAPKTPDVKITIKDYMEKRRERTYAKDEAFHKAITPDHSPEGESKAETVIYRNGIDVRFLIYVIVLLCFGAVMSYSASYFNAGQKYGDSSYFIIRYIIFAIAAIAITIPFVNYARPWFWKCFGTVTYVGSAFLLLIVLLPIPGISGEFNGAQRWIDLGFVTIQPSEIAKTGVVMMLAFYMSKYDKQITTLKSANSDFKHGVFYPACIFGAICLLVMLEKHISGLMIIGMLGIAVMNEMDIDDTRCGCSGGMPFDSCFRLCTGAC